MKNSNTLYSAAFISPNVFALSAKADDIFFSQDGVISSAASHEDISSLATYAYDIEETESIPEENPDIPGNVEKEPSNNDEQGDDADLLVKFD